VRVEDAALRAAEIRASVPPGASVAVDVARIIKAVRQDGDVALEEFEVGFGAGATAPFRASGGALEDDVRAGLEIAIHNVRAVAQAGLDEPRTVRLPEGHTVKLREEPVRRAAIYAPGGRNPYPSTVIMGAVTARAAGRIR
jgi:histidinol dehydrogenase